MTLTSLLDLVLIDLYDCRHETLLNAGWIRQGMLKAAELLGVEVIADSFNTFEPWGVSGTVTIAESHLAVHTWPEYNFVAVTFETCGPNMDHQSAYRFLVNFFGSQRPKMVCQKRGFIESLGGELRYKQEPG
jgi:S-adenosylmethionine decarboxylase